MRNGVIWLEALPKKYNFGTPFGKLFHFFWGQKEYLDFRNIPTPLFWGAYSILYL